MIRYRATRDIKANNIGIHTGDVVLFDGRYTLVSNEPYECPQLMGAVKIGWLVPEDDVFGEKVKVSSGTHFAKFCERYSALLQAGDFAGAENALYEFKHGRKRKTRFERKPPV